MVTRERARAGNDANARATSAACPDVWLDAPVNVAAEIVRALVGSIVLVASVSLKTWVAALACSSGRRTASTTPDIRAGRGRHERSSHEPDDDERAWILTRLDPIPERKH